MGCFLSYRSLGCPLCQPCVSYCWLPAAVVAVVAVVAAVAVVVVTAVAAIRPQTHHHLHDASTLRRVVLRRASLHLGKMTLAENYRSWGGEAYENSYFLDGINADDAYGYLKLMRGISHDEMGSGVSMGIFMAADESHGNRVLETHETLRHVWTDRECVEDSCASPRMTALASVAVGRRPANSSQGMFGIAPYAALAYGGYNSYDISDAELNHSLQFLLSPDQEDVDILIVPSWGASNKLDDYDYYSDNSSSASAETLRGNIADTIFVTDVGGASAFDSALEGLYDIEDNVAFVMSSRDNTSDTCEAVGRNADEDHSNCITVPHLVSGQFAAG